MTPTQKDLIDTDGENRAVRAFLLGREVGCKDYEQMRRHMTNSGFNNCWPSEFAGLGGHMSKGDQQMWLRHLFALERLGALAEQPAEQEPFKPDWDRVEALRESLREHMADVRQLRAALAWIASHKNSDWSERCQQIVDKARAALAEQPAEQEPVAAWEDKYGMKEWEVLALRAGWAPALPNQESDPCPQCKKGGVCRTPKCGRLKLPKDHPCRSAPQQDGETQ